MMVGETEGIHKSSHLQLFFKIGVFKNFSIFTGKHYEYCKRIAFNKEHLGGYLWLHQSIENIPRSNWFKIPRTAYTVRCNFCRCEVVCRATKAEVHCGCFQ